MLEDNLSVSLPFAIILISLTTTHLSSAVKVEDIMPWVAGLELLRIV